ncbi:MAG: class I SAM-dependent methyltransferase [Acidobacteriota bacterium]
MYSGLRSLLPKPLARYVMFFEAAIESTVSDFAAALPQGIRVLDAGAGEGGFRRFFPSQRYTALDLGVGDATWDYSGIDVLGDLSAIPVQSGAFDAAINIVTLEHVREPGLVLQEIARVLAPGGCLLLIAPHEWEEHQQPHDYYRYTRYGLRYLLERAGFTSIDIQPVGGYFRLMSRRLLNGLQFFPGPFLIVAAIFFAPLALVLPLFDSLDKQRNFTLGYICTARKPA